MTIRTSIWIILAVLFFHGLGLAALYAAFDWYDMPMHFGGGLAMGALGLGIWNEGIEDVRLKGALKRHLNWWLVPGIVLGFVALIGILWELHEWILDVFVTGYAYRQPSTSDTMIDFILDLFGGVVALLIWYRK